MIQPCQRPCFRELVSEIRKCEICADRFAATKTAHVPRPVVWFEPGASILVAGQAPGKRVHDAGKPFFDRSGDRLRDWMGIDRDTFYDRRKVAILPTAFCFPGYDSRGADLPPPSVCWETWHERCLEVLEGSALRVLVGGHAIKRHLGWEGSVTGVVRNWKDFTPGVFVLPHPSWRNNGWLRANPWFEEDLVPALRKAVAGALDQGSRQ